MALRRSKGSTVAFGPFKRMQKALQVPNSLPSSPDRTPSLSPDGRSVPSTNVVTDLVRQVRFRFYEEYSLATIETKFLPRDVHLLSVSDHLILRVLKEQCNNVQKSTEWLASLMSWRKHFGIQNLDPSAFDPGLLDAEFLTFVHGNGQDFLVCDAAKLLTASDKFGVVKAVQLIVMKFETVWNNGAARDVVLVVSFALMESKKWSKVINRHLLNELICGCAYFRYPLLCIRILMLDWSIDYESKILYQNILSKEWPLAVKNRITFVSGNQVLKNALAEGTQKYILEDLQALLEPLLPRASSEDSFPRTDKVLQNFVTPHAHVPARGDKPQKSFSGNDTARDDGSVDPSGSENTVTKDSVLPLPASDATADQITSCSPVDDDTRPGIEINTETLGILEDEDVQAGNEPQIVNPVADSPETENPSTAGDALALGTSCIHTKLEEEPGKDLEEKTHTISESRHSSSGCFSFCGVLNCASSAHHSHPENHTGSSGMPGIDPPVTGIYTLRKVDSLDSYSFLKTVAASVHIDYEKSAEGSEEGVRHVPDSGKERQYDVVNDLDSTLWQSDAKVEQRASSGEDQNETANAATVPPASETPVIPKGQSEDVISHSTPHPPSPRQTVSLEDTAVNPRFWCRNTASSRCTSRTTSPLKESLTAGNYDHGDNSIPPSKKKPDQTLQIAAIVSPASSRESFTSARSHRSQDTFGLNSPVPHETAGLGVQSRAAGDEDHFAHTVQKETSPAPHSAHQRGKVFLRGLLGNISGAMFRLTKSSQSAKNAVDFVMERCWLSSTSAIRCAGPKYWSDRFIVLWLRISLQISSLQEKPYLNTFCRMYAGKTRVLGAALALGGVLSYGYPYLYELFGAVTPERQIDDMLRNQSVFDASLVFARTKEASPRDMVAKWAMGGFMRGTAVEIDRRKRSVADALGETASPPSRTLSKKKIVNSWIDIPTEKNPVNGPREILASWTMGNWIRYGLELSHARPSEKQVSEDSTPDTKSCSARTPSPTCIFHLFFPNFEFDFSRILSYMT